MQNNINGYLVSRFAAAIAMPENAIDACPPDLRNRNKGLSGFRYLACRTLFRPDFYLTPAPEDFRSPENTGLSEPDPDCILPSRVFTRRTEGLS